MFKKTLFLSFTLTLLIFSCAKEHMLTNEILDPEIEQIQAEMDEITYEINEVHRLAQMSQAAAESRGIVRVPAGSRDAVMSAVKEAGHGGTVILEAGMHFESSPLYFDKPFKLKGMPGAILEIDAPEQGDAFPVEMKPAIHVYKVGLAKIEGIDIRPKNGAASTGILMEKSPSAVIKGNTLTGFYDGIAVYKSDATNIADNTIEGYSDSVWGILIIDGNHTKITGNHVENYGAAIYASDRKGLLTNNETHNNFIGVLLCNVPKWRVLPDGTLTNSPEPANKWVIKNNNSTNNLWGYLVIDGAFKNFVYQNAAADNSLYDIECTGFTTRFGLPSPTTSKNRVVTLGQYKNLIVKDCGENNKIQGGQLVDNNVDPCY